jgi:hypothetical protein
MQTPFPDAQTGRLPDEAATPAEAPDPQHEATRDKQPRPEPTRYGDWEKAGRCIDF